MRCLLFCLSFLFYLITLSPTVYIGDSGELITSAFSLGVSHPPGYPLYTVLGKIFTLIIPFGSIAYRVNLMSAVLASITIFCFYLLIKEVIYSVASINTSKSSSTTFYSLLFNDYLLLTVALCFAFSKTFWSQAVISEVYTLNALFVAITLLLVLKGIKVSQPKAEKPQNLFLLAFIFGLSLCNHHTMLLLAPVYLIFILKGIKDKVLTPRNLETLIPILLLVFLALSIYLYLPLRSLANPLVDWGNPENIKNFTHTIFRKQYKTVVEQVRGIPIMFQQIKSYIVSLSSQMTVFGLLISAFGLFFLFKKNKRIGFFTFFLWVFTSVVIIAINNFRLTAFDLEVVEVFYIPSYIIVAIWLGIGISKVVRLHKTMYVLPVVLLIIVILSNYNFNNQSRILLAYFHGKNLLNVKDNKSILFVAAEDNDVFPVSYLKLVEGYKRNITVYDDLGCVLTKIYGDDFKWMNKTLQVLRMNAVQGALLDKSDFTMYSSLSSNINNLILERPDFTVLPMGVKYILKRTPQEWKKYIFFNKDEVKLSRYFLRNEFIPFLTDEQVSHSFFIRSLLSRISYMRAENFFAGRDFKRAVMFCTASSEFGYDIGWLQNAIGNLYSKYNFKKEAISHYKKVIELEPTRPEPHNNIGGIYMSQGKLNKAVREFKKAIKKNPYFIAAINNLGVVYKRKGDLKSARKCWERALQINPNCIPAKVNIESLLY